MIKNSTAIITLLTIFILAGAASAQFTIKLPNVTIKGKQPKQTETVARENDTTAAERPNVRTKGADNIYKLQLPTAEPVLLKNTVYVQAKTHYEYWKMKDQRNFSSWVPMLRFDMFYNNDRALNYTVEYFNPDGSLWYSEKLEQGRQASDRTVLFQSPSPWGGVLDTKSTNATGVFSFKVTDQDTKQVVYHGKFKVGKFSTSYDPAREKNKFDFFVDHDWLMPFGMIGFHHSIDPVGGMPPLASVWMKGPVEASELEGRVFYKGQQIASTKDDDGGSGVSDYDERTSEFAASSSPLNRWKRWQFQWGNFRFDNNGTFNRDYYPKAHYADKNPGDYTIKIYRNGTQVREMSFTIGLDGRFVVPGYANQIPQPYHRIILPVKLIDNGEKWNSLAWKTDAFYGNPLTGFTVQ